jgi:hypothetical protein
MSIRFRGSPTMTPSRAQHQRLDHSCPLSRPKSSSSACRRRARSGLTVPERRLSQSCEPCQGICGHYEDRIGKVVCASAGKAWRRGTSEIIDCMIWKSPSFRGSILLAHENPRNRLSVGVLQLSPRIGPGYLLSGCDGEH